MYVSIIEMNDDATNKTHTDIFIYTHTHKYRN